MLSSKYTILYRLNLRNFQRYMIICSAWWFFSVTRFSIHNKSNIPSLQILCIQCMIDYNVPYDVKPNSNNATKKKSSWNPLKSFTKKSSQKKEHLLSEDENNVNTQDFIRDIEIEMKKLNQNTRHKVIRALEECYAQYMDQTTSTHMTQFHPNAHNSFDNDPLFQPKQIATDRLPRHDPELYDNTISTILQERMQFSQPSLNKKQSWTCAVLLIRLDEELPW